MYLIQLLLPLYDNDQRPFPRLNFDDVRRNLTEHFGGVTAYLRSPAVGLWKENETNVSRDEVVMFEVMSKELDERWRSQYRRDLERTFQQEEVLVRAVTVRKL
jgi:hypothetical protein